MRPVVTHSTMWVDNPSTIARRAAGSCFLKRSISGTVSWRPMLGGNPIVTRPTGSSRLAEIFAGVSHQLHDGHAVVEQSLACVGQRHPAPIAKEKLLGQLGLEAAHLPAERGLGDIERQRRLAEAAQFGNLHEIFELFEVHGIETVLCSC